MDRSACTLLSEIEEELSALRAKTVANLEQKLHERKQQLSFVSSSFLQLQQDFHFNLQLLDDRDAELSQHEAEINDLQSELEQNSCLMEGLQASLAQAQSDLEREQQVVHSATELWQAHHDRLVQENVEARQHSEEQLRSISAGFEQSQGALLVDLAEARSALAAQTQQIQRLQAAQDEAAKQVAAAQQAAAAAQQSCVDATAASKALQRRWEDADTEREELRRQLDRERRRLNARITDLEEEKEARFQRQETAMELLRIELGAAVAASKAAEGRAETAAASAAQQQAALKSEIASLTERCKEHVKAERETAQQLEAARKEARQQEERLRSQYGAEASGLRRELQEAERRYTEDLRRSKSEAEAAMAPLKAKVESLQLALKDGGSTALKLQQAKAAVSAKDAELAVLRCELAALRAGTPQASGAAGRREAAAREAAAQPPPGFSDTAALRYSHLGHGWDVSEPGTPHWLDEPLPATDQGVSSGDEPSRQLRSENTKLQAALEGTREENARLCAALGTLRAAMEAATRAASTHPATGIAELEAQLAAAQRSVERLTDENERLMEISNRLRAERHKLDRAAAQAGFVQQPSGASSAVVPAQAWGMPQYPQMPPGLLPHSMLGAREAACGFTAPLHCFVVPQYLPPPQFPPPLTQHQSPSRDQQRTGPDARAAAAKGCDAEGADAGGGTDADVAHRLRRIEALAEEIARAQVSGGQNRQRMANGRSSRLSQESAAQHVAQGDEENAGAMAANVGALKVNAPLKTASPSCAPSQRERLRAMQLKAPGAKVARVRNWNVLDDDKASC